MFSKTLSLASILALSLSASAFTTVCYSDSGSLKSIGSSKYASTELCSKQCSDRELPVAAITGGDECWCGTEVPPEDTKADKEKCAVRCPGWPKSTCGGDGFWEVWLPKARGPYTVNAIPTGRAESFIA